jgi:BASS family bile acid:Na+ symporter
MPLKRSICLFSIIVLGLGLQWGHRHASVIRYALMGMLFLAWIDSKVSLRTFGHPKLWQLVGLMACIAAAGFTFFSLIDAQLALTAGLLAMTPTALAAPVVTSLLRGQVEFVTASVFITNGLIAILLPIILPILSIHNPEQQGAQVMFDTLIVVGLPLLLAEWIRHQIPGFSERLKRLKSLTFYLWLIGLYFASAKAGYFIRENDQNFIMLSMIAMVALILCILNFGLGRWLGKPSLVQETGQALGQKNTMLAIWICLTFLSPTTALGPMFYIVFQNIFNAYLLARSPHC